MYSIKNYWEISKPKISFLLVLVAVTGYILAVNTLNFDFSFTTLSLIIVGMWTGSSGCSSLTAYTDRDMDAIMNRTKNRAIPTKKIFPPVKAVYFGFILIGISLIISFWLSFFAFVLMVLGILDNVLIYSLWLKRRSVWNIILGGLSGGVPVLYSWVIVSGGSLSLVPWMIALLVMTWIPSHTWYLALHSKEDYEAVNVPMLPVVRSEETAIRITTLTVPMMVFTSLLLGYIGGFGLIYWVPTSLMGLYILYESAKTIRKPDMDLHWKMFKISSPYLSLVLIALIIDSYIPLWI